MTKTIQNLIHETLASLATLPRMPEKPLSLSKDSKKQEGPKVNLCKSKWQQKWLRLDIVSAKLQELADEAERFCARWFQNSPNPALLVIVGSYGSGKTHVARAIFRFCSVAAFSSFETKKWGNHKMPNASFIAWPEASNAFNEKLFGLMEDAIENDLVILDDIGSENDPWKICADKLCQILSRRERKFTVITTNVSPAQWTERFDGRINDRLLRNSTVVDITGVSSYAMKS